MASAAAQLKALHEKLELESGAYRDIVNDISKNTTLRSQFAQQFNENDMVLKELERLEDDSNVFKLIGPVLIKQDPVEAKATVSKRIEYIKGESSRLDSQLKSLEDKQEKKKAEIIAIQKKVQALQGGGSQ